MKYEQIACDFAKRTLMILESYRGEFETTMLVNCCLGLLVVPQEKDIAKIPDTIIPENGELWGLDRASITVNCQSCGYSLSNIVRKIRNGICHFNLESIPDDNGEINCLEIRDRGGFRARLTPAQLRVFVMALVSHVYGERGCR